MEPGGGFVESSNMDKRTRAAMVNAGAMSEMAQAAARGETVAFAKQALEALQALGFDPAAMQFWRNRASGEKPSMNYLQWVCSDLEGAGSSAMLEALIQSGADLEATGEPDGRTPLWICARSGNVQAARALSDAGASWSGGRVAQEGLGLEMETAAEALMQSGPREHGWDQKKKGLSDHAKKWGALMGPAIDGVKGDARALRSILHKLAVCVASEEALAPAALALAGAGVDPLKKTREVEESQMAPGKASPLTLSALWAAREQTQAFFALCGAFPEAAERSASACLAAFGAGMAIRVDDWDALTDQTHLSKSRRREWLPADKKTRLARIFAKADPCELAAMSAGSLRLSFAYAMGALCQPQRVGASEFEEGAEFFSEWLKRSREAKTPWSEAAFAQAFAKGASDSGQVSQDQDHRQRLDTLPKPRDLEAALSRAEKLMGLDKKLAARDGSVKAAIASGWAREAQAAAKEADVGEERAQEWLAFAEAARARLERPDIRSSLEPGEFESAMEALSAGAARAARRHKIGDDDDGEFIGRRLEKFAISLATSASAAAPSKPAPRL